ncbi:MAG TPA: hypothetical protein VGE72_02425, partial [Azospirillum sp.]
MAAGKKSGSVGLLVVVSVAVAAAAGMGATSVIASKGPRERPRAEVVAVHTDVVAVARSAAADPVPAVLLPRADW